MFYVTCGNFGNAHLTFSKIVADIGRNVNTAWGIEPYNVSSS